MIEQKVGLLTFHLDFSQPLYEQVIDQIRSAVAKGEIGLGEKIPSVRELAQALKINPNTVMRAYQELEREGITEKRRGQGTYITTSQEHIQKFRMELAQRFVEDFIQKMEGIGYSWDEIYTFLKNYGEQKGGGTAR